nr:hypothetical protein [Tanacetum cinerariifolium]
MYYAEDRGFEMYPPLNEDKVGKDDLLVWCANLENDLAKILKGINEGKNDASKSVKFNEGVHVSVDGMSEGMNDDAYIVTGSNDISIRENDDVNAVSTDNESDSDDHGDHQSETDSDESDKSFDYLSNGEDE